MEKVLFAQEISVQIFCILCMFDLVGRIAKLLMCVCVCVCVGDGSEGSDGAVGGLRERVRRRRSLAQLHLRTRLEMEGRHLL